MITFNKTFITGKEVEYIQAAIQKQTSGNGAFTKKCHEFFHKKYGFKKVFLTTSCTDALEMSAILLDIKPGDEVIIPSFTFVSTANAFILRGAKIVFADSLPGNPNTDASQLEKLITPRTKAIVVVHYAGVAVNMTEVMKLATKFKIFVIEDAAQAIDAYFEQRPLGGIGHLGCLSFHDTKNIVSGEGGMLVVNDDSFIERAGIIWEKGTNRNAFVRGEVKNYEWVDVGSSFLPSEITSAFLLAQLENLDTIQSRRLERWNYYMDKLSPLLSKFNVSPPQIPAFSKHNGHIFYLVCESNAQRNHLINFLKQNDIQAYFHYPPLHLSPFFLKKNDADFLPNAVKFSERLVRLPLYVDLTQADQDLVISKIEEGLGNF